MRMLQCCCNLKGRDTAALEGGRGTVKTAAALKVVVVVKGWQGGQGGREGKKKEKEEEKQRGRM